MQRIHTPAVALFVVCGTGASVLFPVAAAAQLSASERVMELALRRIDPGRGPSDAIGPDVIVGELMGGSSGSTSISPAATNPTELAYGIGTISCNKGDEELLWVSSTNQHPVIAQNMYRIKDGRFEQIGQSWLKHGFTALQQNTCNLGCIPSGTGSRLGVGCSDPYSASLNASQSSLGPRYQVNPFTGYFPYPWSSTVPGTGSNSMARRLRVSVADIEVGPTDTIYVVEGQYVAPDDAAAGNGANNASYRRFTFAANRSLQLVGPTVQEVPAIYAWRDIGNNGDPDPTVAITPVNLLPHDGYFLIGSKVIDLGEGRWRYEYAVQNLNSDRMGGIFRVPIPFGVNVTGIEWRGVDSHSGFPAEDATRNAAWTIVQTNPTMPNGSHIEWAAPVPFDPSRPWEGNGLRWSTVYNFRFIADVPPNASGEVIVGLYKPAAAPAPAAFSAKAWVPSEISIPCYANCDGSTNEPILNVDDFTCFINEFAQALSLSHEQQVMHYANCDGSTNAPVLNVDDFSCFINEFAAGCR